MSAMRNLSPDALRDRTRVERHDRDRRRYRRPVAVHHHRGRVSDQDGIHPRTRDEASGPGIVGRHDGDLVAFRLQARKVQHRAHRRLPRPRVVRRCDVD